MLLASGLESSCDTCEQMTRKETETFQTTAYSFLQSQRLIRCLVHISINIEHLTCMFVFIVSLLYFSSLRISSQESQFHAVTKKIDMWPDHRLRVFRFIVAYADSYSHGFPLIVGLLHP